MDESALSFVTKTMRLDILAKHLEVQPSEMALAKAVGLYLFDVYSDTSIFNQEWLEDRICDNRHECFSLESLGNQLGTLNLYIEDILGAVPHAVLFRRILDAVKTNPLEYVFEMVRVISQRRLSKKISDINRFNPKAERRERLARLYEDKCLSVLMGLIQKGM